MQDCCRAIENDDLVPFACGYRRGVQWWLYRCDTCGDPFVEADLLNPVDGVARCTEANARGRQPLEHMDTWLINHFAQLPRDADPRTTSLDVIYRHMTGEHTSNGRGRC